MNYTGMRQFSNLARSPVISLAIALGTCAEIQRKGAKETTLDLISFAFAASQRFCGQTRSQPELKRTLLRADAREMTGAVCDCLIEAD